MEHKLTDSWISVSIKHVKDSRWDIILKSLDMLAKDAKATPEFLAAGLAKFVLDNNVNTSEQVLKKAIPNIDMKDFTEKVLKARKKDFALDADQIYFIINNNELAIR